MALEKVDDAVTSAGYAYIIFQIVAGAIVLVTCLAALVYVNFFYRRGWVTDEALVDSVSCTSQAKQTCTNSKTSSQCTSQTVSKCTLALTIGSEAFTLSKTYDENLVPAEGSSVTVYHDPSDASKASLIATFPKAAANAIIGVVFAIVALLLFALYKFRENKTAQRIGAVMLVRDIVKN